MAAKTTFYCDLVALEAIIAAGNFKRIKLFKNNFTPDENSVAADFDEADYSGYADQLLTFSPAFLNGTPAAQANAGSNTWVRGVGGTDNLIYGVYVIDHAISEVTAYEKFAAPVSMVIPSVDSIFYQFSPTAVAG